MITRRNTTPLIHTALLQDVDVPQQRIVLNSPQILIGRAAAGENDIPLPTHDHDASRHHASLIYDDGVWTLEDHSLNGTYVNGKRILGSKVVLHDGDYIRVGKMFHVVFKDLEMTHLDDTQTHISPMHEEITDIPMKSPSVGLWLSEDGQLYRDGAIVGQSLSKIEYRLLKYLMAHIGKIALAELYKTALVGMCDEPHLKELLVRMQQKLEPNPFTPRFLHLDHNDHIYFNPSGNAR